MKPGLSKVLKIFLITVAVILAVLLLFGIVLVVGWPWWVGFFLCLGVLGLVIGAVFLKKIMLKRKEEDFVQQVIAQDEAQLKNLSGKERDELKELQDKWKEAVDALRKSHLKKLGNPLYVLPWYLVMGESGSGKTTALNSARLSSPFVEVSRTSGISGTRSCDWWFFEQAIVIDTAGRYAVPVDEGKDKEEWQRFLSLLIKYRKKEPIHGLAITMAADKLIQAAPEALEEEGRTIRRRIDELMRVLGAKFPVYFLVSKCDLVQGMTQFADQLPEKALDQPMGFVNQDLSSDVEGLVDQSLNTIGERLRNLRIQLLHQSESKTVDPAFLLFPEEFENLRPGLKAFAKGAFQQNPYQETPILRGIFFSSGRQEGSPYSHFLRALGLIEERDVLPGTNKGLFLHDFFSVVLPRDKGLFAPTKRALQWQALTRNLGLTSWVVIALALCGLLSFSFVKNLKAIREVPQEFAKAIPLKGDTFADLLTMDRFAKSVLKVEDANRNWWIPRFGLYESKEVELGLKRRYCNQFQTVFLSAFDKQMAAAMSGLNVSTPDEVIGMYATHIVRRINLLKARLETQDYDLLKKKPQPSYVSFTGAAQEQTLGADVREKFGSLYLYYLLWRGDTVEINREIDMLVSWLRHLMGLRGGNLQWIVVWVNKYGGLPYVTLEEFWGGSAAVPNEKFVWPAYTRKGKEMIDSFLKEMEQAMPEPAMLATPKSNFEKWYRATCLDTWQGFAAFFPRGVERLKGQKEWQQMAVKMASEVNPYFGMMTRATVELEPLVGSEALPGWVQQVYQFQLVKTQSLAGGVLDKAAEEGKKILSKVEQAVGRTVGEGAQQHAAAVKAYQEYQQALTGLGPVASSRSQAFQIATQTFSEDGATSKSPFFVAQRAASKVRTSLVAGKQADDLFWNLLSGPYTYLWAYTRMETACYLQSQWEEKVLAEVHGVSGPQVTQLLLGQDGHVWKFIKGPAAPFFGKSLQKGYASREVLGGSIPFEPALNTFLSKGAKVQAQAQTQTQAQAQAKESYPVGVKGLPTDANPEARIKPRATRLELQCAAGNQTLLNENYPISKTFNWAPETCANVIFQIEVGDVVLVKKYLGPHGFPDFLNDFKGGQRVFYAQDFPVERQALERLGIKYIRVNYLVTGAQAIHQAMQGQARVAPGQAPRTIVRCWDR